MKSVCIVYSENAGQFESYRIELENITNRLAKIMDARVERVELEALEKVSLAKYDAVFVMGGDGSVGRTLGKVSTQMRRIPVGIIPAGTGNIFAECLGLMKEDRANLIQYALDVIEAKRIATVDIGMANGTAFVIDVGLGPFATAITKPDTDEKFHQGMLSYVKPLFSALRKRPYRFRITADGESFEITASAIFVSNPPEIGIGQSADLSGIQDGMLDLCIMQPEEIDDYFRIAKKYGAWFIAGVSLDDTPYKVMKVKEVEIEALAPAGKVSPMTRMLDLEELPLEEKRNGNSRELKTMRDGDPFEFTPLRVSVLPGAVDVFVPEEALVSTS
ncbi:MAG: diacylglycerol kinase family protein [Cyanobacteriota/Melainabacteria group bacterium]|nr:hypothetical protein [Cyanobacteria bacterium HKST-UBA01]MCB9472085.1 hypothetical protein [Candidatus Obscuribacterales bacterium]